MWTWTFLVALEPWLLGPTVVARLHCYLVVALELKTMETSLASVPSEMMGLRVLGSADSTM